MNIFVPISWLKDFLQTKASGEKIAESLSLCSQSVERIHQSGQDQVLEIEITVNRSDCLSISGIARELSAILPQFGLPAQFIKPEDYQIPKINKQTKENQISVEIENPTICPRFTAIVLEKVKVADSPDWLKQRLEKVGLRSLNNVVDISNYLMMETGQPIHTFDFEKILGQKMVMRLAKKGEKVVTLDGTERKLAGGDIVIEDGKGRLIDLCGIMGGKNSEIDQNTRKVLFFVQAYDPVRIRKTSMSLGLRTEAAMRFERGIDLEGILPVIAKGVQLMSDLASAKVASRLIDIYPQKQPKYKIEATYDFIVKGLGVELEAKKILVILENLGFNIIYKDEKRFKVQVPTWRTKDIQIKEDLLEEVARVHGYFKLPSKIPSLSQDYGLTPLKPPQKGTISPKFIFEDRAKDVLKSCGFFETYNFSFVSEQLINKCNLNPESHLKLTNPLNADLAFLRVSLIPSLMTVFERNINFPQKMIFEMANVYLENKNDLPAENLMLSGISDVLDYSQIKGIVELILNELGVFNFKLKVEDKGKQPFANQEQSTDIYFNDVFLGSIGLVSYDVLQNFKLNQKIYFFDLNLTAIFQFANNKKTLKPIAKFPPLIQDLSFVFPEKTEVGEVIQQIKEVDEIIDDVQLIDSFEETRTFRIYFQNPERTLSNKEVEEVRKNIIKRILKAAGGELKNQPGLSVSSSSHC